MRRASVVSLVAAGVLLSVGGAVVVRWASSGAGNLSRAKNEGTPAASLEFRELMESGAALRPSAKALALHGKRVRVVGFMAEMEEPIQGAFYLVPRPMRLDESGAGTGDLPLESILVVVPGAEGKTLPQVEGPLEGIGVLDVGNRADDQGRVSNFRLSLDSPRAVADVAGRASQTSTSQPASPSYAAVAASRN
jgi:hypothetical protein